MIVYSNTTPFIALASIDRLDLLPALFGKVYVAEYLGLNITGTLGVLIKAKALGLIPSFVDAVMDMQQQGIRYNQKLIARLAAHIEEGSQ